MPRNTLNPLNGKDGLPRLVLVGAPVPGHPEEMHVTAYRVNFDDAFTAIDMLIQSLPAAMQATVQAAVSLGMGEARRQAQIEAETTAKGIPVMDDAAGEPVCVIFGDSASDIITPSTEAAE